MAIACAVLAAPAPARAAEQRVPRGYEIVGRDALGKGLTHIALASSSQQVHVALVGRSSSFELRPVIAGDVVIGKPSLERTSSMCARIRCVVAVNGDFFAATGAPSGDVVIDGEPVRSGYRKRDQLLVDAEGDVAAGALRFEVALVSSDLRRLALDGLNVPPPRSGSVLYTPRFGRSTAAPSSSLEVTLRIEAARGRLRVGETVAARIRGWGSRGNAAIPRDGAVVSVRGKKARQLRALLARVKEGKASRRVLLRVDAAPSVAESVGGRPVLVRDGKRVALNDASPFAAGRHPRTLAGRTRAGDVLLVTVDGRQPPHSRGMSLGEAADLMIALGAVEAINLDGGGSTTFVVRGKVANRPSDRAVRRKRARAIVAVPGPADEIVGNAERPVAVALAVVPARAARVASGDRSGGTEVASLVQGVPLLLPPPTEQDPASNPDAALPALLVPKEAAESSREALLAAAALLWGAVATRLLASIAAPSHRRPRARPRRERPLSRRALSRGEGAGARRVDAHGRRGRADVR